MLDDLATGTAARDTDRVAELLAWEPRIDVADLSAQSGLEPGRVRAALTMLGTAGQIGYDLAEEAYYHRHLPYAAGTAEIRNPRLRGAKALVAQGAVRIDGALAWVEAGDIPGVLQALGELGVEQRAAQLPELTARYEEMGVPGWLKLTAEQKVALASARLGCQVTPDAAARHLHSGGRYVPSHDGWMVDVVDLFPVAWWTELVARLDQQVRERSGSQRLHLVVDHIVRTTGCPMPESDYFLKGWLSRHSYGPSDRLLERLREDPLTSTLLPLALQRPSVPLSTQMLSALCTSPPRGWWTVRHSSAEPSRSWPTSILPPRSTTGRPCPSPPTSTPGRHPSGPPWPRRCSRISSRAAHSGRSHRSWRSCGLWPPLRPRRLPSSGTTWPCSTCRPRWPPTARRSCANWTRRDCWRRTC